jgi:hypothetical protein
MRISEALVIMQAVPKTTCEHGFMVHFERVDGCALIGDYFPDKHCGETLIESESMAWDLAAKFASHTVGKCVNVYVVTADFVPVCGYDLRKIANRQ